MPARRSILFALFLILLAACGGVNEENVAESIRTVVAGDEPFGADGRDAFRDEVRAFYEERDFEPAWVVSSRGRDSLRVVLDVLCRAGEDGLDPGDYANGALERLIRQAYQEAPRDDSLEARNLARLDVAVTHALMDYASDLLQGRVDPHEFGTAWHTPVKEVDLAHVLEGATRLDSLRRLPRQLTAAHDQYGKLRSALGRYRQIAERGGWRSVPAGEALEEGAVGPRVDALIARLAATGDLDTTTADARATDTNAADTAVADMNAAETTAAETNAADTNAADTREAEAVDSLHAYTARIAEAVKRFQRRHGLEVDGVAGEGVIEAMNVPVEERIRQIEVNLERWRWIPSDLGSRYLYVNIPAYELHVLERGRPVLSMNVIVGEVYTENATPVFSDTMQYVEFNPYWNVPERIATEEILPKARRDPGYLSRNGYEIVAGWNARRALDSSTADLSMVESGSYRIRQKPGRSNSLGQIKFMFPNQFDIYLHDTPADYLFARAERAYSHGCIRVEEPVKLAEYVLGDGEWTAEKIREVISSRTNRSVAIEEPLPVYIMYWTAFVGEDGSMNFRDDIYGYDETLRQALDRDGSPSEAVPCDSLTALIR